VAVHFVGLDCDVLVTASEDRTFVVWDVATLAPLYRSGYETPGVFLALAVGPGNRLYLGASEYCVFLILRCANPAVRVLVT
jgi:hypothetical protein